MLGVLILLGTLQWSLAFVPHGYRVRAVANFANTIRPSAKRVRTSSVNTNANLLVGANSGKRNIHTLQIAANRQSVDDGADEPSVDMNQYNLPLEQILEEWTATIQPKTVMQAGGAFVGAKSDKEIMVDKVRITFPRNPESGMGILLEEIAGGRDDDLGITVVSGVVEGGAADGCGIQEGDSISSISVRRLTSETTQESLQDSEEIMTVSTECLGYDATVDQILSLPAAEGDNEAFVLSMNRLRRRPRVTVTIQYPNRKEKTVELFSGENLRRGMLARGVEINDPLARRFDNGGTGDCGAAGTCATCAVRVVEGDELLNPQAAREQQILKGKDRWRLGCGAVVGHGNTEGDLILRVSPNQWTD